MDIFENHYMYVKYTTYVVNTRLTTHYFIRMFFTFILYIDNHFNKKACAFYSCIFYQCPKNELQKLYAKEVHYPYLAFHLLKPFWVMVLVDAAR